ncbi:MAG: FmdB family transcriptional regulator [Candidatus Eremiobacteraeota bacterium]|nr:FmdB family transcriptional regulator [Candidatus Eremiobacteraeota bacterium]
MPIYEYQCANCAALTDVKHGFKEANSEPCPSCGGALIRRFTPAGIVFKGTGFYVNDSRKPAADGEAKPKEPAKAESGEAGSKADPAVKTDSGAKAEPSHKSEPAKTGSAAKTGKGDAAA